MVREDDRTISCEIMFREDGIEVAANEWDLL